MGWRAGATCTTQVKIVGVLKPTGTADDRALFMNIEGFYLLPGHALGARGQKKRTRISKETARRRKTATRIRKKEEEHEQEEKEL